MFQRIESKEVRVVLFEQNAVIARNGDEPPARSRDDHHQNGQRYDQPPVGAKRRRCIGPVARVLSHSSSRAARESCLPS